MNDEVITPVVKGFTWSYSRLKNFETCPKRYYHYEITKDVREPESAQIIAGNALHEAFRARVAEGKKLPLGMGQHEKLLAKLASASGEIMCEQKLGLKDDLSPSAFFGKGVWFRTVLDYVRIFPDGQTALVIDYKTGKPATDDTQVALCALTLFQHVDKLQRVRTGLWFVNYDQIVHREFERNDVFKIVDNTLPRVAAMVRARADQEYPAKPGPFCRRWCAVTSCQFHGV